MSPVLFTPAVWVSLEAVVHQQIMHKVTSTTMITTASSIILSIIIYSFNNHFNLTDYRLTGTEQWRRKMFCCRGAENMRTWCTMVV